MDDFNKIPAGTMVKIGKQEGTVISHGDGVVHVDIDGDEVSVDPSQVETVRPLRGQSQTTAPPTPKKKGKGMGENEPGAGADIFSDEEGLALELIRKMDDTVSVLQSRIAAFEGDSRSIMTAVAELQSRVLAMDADILRLEGLIAHLSVQPEQGPEQADSA